MLHYDYLLVPLCGREFSCGIFPGRQADSGEGAKAMGGKATLTFGLDPIGGPGTIHLVRSVRELPIDMTRLMTLLPADCSNPNLGPSRLMRARFGAKWKRGLDG